MTDNYDLQLKQVQIAPDCFQDPAVLKRDKCIYTLPVTLDGDQEIVWTLQWERQGDSFQNISDSVPENLSAEDLSAIEKTLFVADRILRRTLAARLEPGRHRGAFALRIGYYITRNGVEGWDSSEERDHIIRQMMIGLFNTQNASPIHEVLAAALVPLSASPRLDVTQQQNTEEIGRLITGLMKFIPTLTLSLRKLIPPEQEAILYADQDQVSAAELKVFSHLSSLFEYGISLMVETFKGQGFRYAEDFEKVVRGFSFFKENRIEPYASMGLCPLLQETFASLRAPESHQQVAVKESLEQLIFCEEATKYPIGISDQVVASEVIVRHFIRSDHRLHFKTDVHQSVARQGVGAKRAPLVDQVFEEKIPDPKDSESPLVSIWDIVVESYVDALIWEFPKGQDPVLVLPLGKMVDVGSKLTRALGKRRHYLIAVKEFLTLLSNPKHEQLSFRLRMQGKFYNLRIQIPKADVGQTSVQDYIEILEGEISASEHLSADVVPYVEYGVAGTGLLTTVAGLLHEPLTMDEGLKNHLLLWGPTAVGAGLGSNLAYHYADYIQNEYLRRAFGILVGGAAGFGVGALLCGSVGKGTLCILESSGGGGGGKQDLSGRNHEREYGPLRVRTARTPSFRLTLPF